MIDDQIKALLKIVIKQNYLIGGLIYNRGFVDEMIMVHNNIEALIEELKFDLDKGEHNDS